MERSGADAKTRGTGRCRGKGASRAGSFASYGHDFISSQFDDPELGLFVRFLVTFCAHLELLYHKTRGAMPYHPCRILIL